MIKLSLINLLVMSYRKYLNYSQLIIFRPIRFKMSWTIGHNRQFFQKLKSKLGLYYVVQTTPKTSVEKLTLTAAEKQQLPDIEKTDPKEENSCLKWTIFIGSRKVCINLKTDTDKLNIVVNRCRNKLYLEDKIDLKMTNTRSS